MAGADAGNLDSSLALLAEVGLTPAAWPPQLGLVVADLDREVANAEGLGNFGEFRRFTIESSSWSEIVHRGAPAELSFAVALNDLTPQTEYIQPLTGESVYREFLDAGGSGLHHFGFQVDDIAAASAALARAGFEPVFHGRGLGRYEEGGFAYFDTSKALGFWLELLQDPS
jgi:methylmalonyl-CoA/ethylmalonyl-CoA epimerase